MRAFLFALILSGLFANAQTVPAPCTNAPSFYAAGASFNAAATPNGAGFFAIAVPLMKCGSSFQVYSYTANNITGRGHGKDFVFLNTTSTGAAIPLKQIGPFDVYAFGSMGVTTNGQAANLAGTYGGLISFPFWKNAWLRGLLAAQKVEGMSVYGFGLGRSW